MQVIKASHALWDRATSGRSCSANADPILSRVRLEAAFRTSAPVSSKLFLLSCWIPCTRARIASAGCCSMYAITESGYFSSSCSNACCTKWYTKSLLMSLLPSNRFGAQSIIWASNGCPFEEEETSPFFCKHSSKSCRSISSPTQFPFFNTANTASFIHFEHRVSRMAARRFGDNGFVDKTYLVCSHGRISRQSLSSDCIKVVCSCCHPACSIGSIFCCCCVFLHLSRIPSTVSTCAFSDKVEAVITSQAAQAINVGCWCSWLYFVATMASLPVLFLKWCNTSNAASWRRLSSQMDNSCSSRSMNAAGWCSSICFASENAASSLCRNRSRSKEYTSFGSAACRDACARATGSFHIYIYTRRSSVHVVDGRVGLDIFVTGRISVRSFLRRLLNTQEQVDRFPERNKSLRVRAALLRDQPMLVVVLLISSAGDQNIHGN